MRPSTPTVIDASTEKLLRRAAALALAQHPHPNPRVGCVVRSASGDIVGEGDHVAAGEAHAEIVALQAAGASADGSTLVVTLEPCVHVGRTPPCVDAIVAAGVQTVVIGAVDPDTRVSGAGVAALEDADIEVIIAGEAQATHWVDPGYFHHRRTGYPFVTLKLATTLDGQIAAADGSSQWITSEAARADVHRLRSRSDAVMVGAGTLIADNPRLTVRNNGYDGQQPVPVVIAGRRELSSDAALFAADALVYATEEQHIESAVWTTVPGVDGVVDLDAVVADLGRRGLIDVLVEGGPRLAHALLAAGLVQRVVWYLGAKLAGGQGIPAAAGVFATLSDALDLDILTVTEVGPDVRIVADVMGSS